MSTLEYPIWVQGHFDDKFVLFPAGTSLPTWAEGSFAAFGAEPSVEGSNTVFLLPTAESEPHYPALNIFQGTDESRCVGRYMLMTGWPPPHRLRFLLKDNGKLSIEPLSRLKIGRWRTDPEVSSVIVGGPADAPELGQTTKPDATKALVFVSHAASDAQHALDLVDAIERNGGRCWIAPRNVRAGKDFREEIVTAIERCDSMVVLISKAANGSEHVLRELGLADKFKKPVKPVRLDDCELARAFEYQLHAKHWIRYEPSFKFVDALIAE